MDIQIISRSEGACAGCCLIQTTTHKVYLYLIIQVFQFVFYFTLLVNAKLLSTKDFQILQGKSSLKH